MTYDFRDYGHVSGMRDQGGCGSCWAFAAVAYYESLLLRFGQYTGDIDLAEQFPLECTDPGNQGCNGGWPTDAIEYVKNVGIPA